MQLHTELGQLRPVGDAELAAQCGDVALHGPHGQEQPFGDLPVAQPFGDRREYLGLAFGHARTDQPLGQATPDTRHAGIVR